MIYYMQQFDKGVAMQQSNKKLTIICILDILKEFSDENHPLTQSEIVKKLKSIYAIECERKSVSKTIDSLIDYGYDIIKLDRGGCYLGERELEASEVAFLIDAVFASKSVSSKLAKDLADKLSKLRSNYEQKRFKYIFKADEISRTINKSFFYNIDIINEAIDAGKKIKFKYNLYDCGKNLKSRSEEFYIINPYFLLNNNGRYYLVCNREDFPLMSNYRLDFITDIRLCEEPIKPATEVKGFEKGLDITSYVNENIYMFGDTSVKATLKLASIWAVSNLLDWFGKSARVYEKEENSNHVYYADVTVSETAIIYWSLQYGQNVEILSPNETREKIAQMARDIAKKYEK